MSSKALVITHPSPSKWKALLQITCVQYVIGTVKLQKFTAGRHLHFYSEILLNGDIRYQQEIYAVCCRLRTRIKSNYVSVISCRLYFILQEDDGSKFRLK
jgi:hypothetical protein